MARIRPDLVLFGSFLSTVLVIGNAFYHKKQFYPSVVHLTKSNGSMAVLYFQAFIFALIFGKLMNKLFFGQLRAIEIEHLMERSWFALTETCLAFTVFRDDFSPKFVTMFTILFFFKCFHWLAEDRVDYMERSPIITLLFHLRILVLSLVLMLLDFYFIYNAYTYTLQKGASVQIVFGFEYAILFINILSIFLKYLLHTIDLQNENPWENKGVYMLYSDLFLGLIRVILYFTFVGIMIKIHTFPLFAIRPIYLSLRSFKKCVSDVVLSRRAIRNLNTMYPDVTAEQLSSYTDTICIICREEMLGEQKIKKLPCEHIFHKNCLRSWFQRQQTCPTCRTPILRYNNEQVNIQGGAAAGFQVPGGVGGNVGAAGGGGVGGGVNNNQQQGSQQAQPMSSQPNSSANLASNNNNNEPPNPFFSQNNNSQQFQPNFGFNTNIMPPFMFPPPPLPDLNLSALNDDELRSLEGDERNNLEARVHCLRNINTLLNGAFVHIQQYMNITMADSHLNNLRGSTSRIKVEDDLKYLNKTTSQPSTSSFAAAASTETTSQLNRQENSTFNLNDDLDLEKDDLRKRRLEHFKSQQDE